MSKLGASRLCLLAILIAGVAGLGGCKRAGEAVAERAIETASGDTVDIEQHGDTVSIKTDEGEMKVATAQDGGSVALPADFPTDVFLPAQRAVNSAMDMGGMKMVNVTTSAAPAAVSADVEKAMQAQGWKREMAMQAEGSSTLIYTKDQRQAVYQMMQADGGGTQLAIRSGGG
jgi:hypothetical protein